MKYSITKIAVIAISIFAIIGTANADITKEEAKNFVLNQVLEDEIGKVDVFVSNNVITSGELQLFNKTLSCPYVSSWVFFVDDLIYAIWEHPCRYIFVNAVDFEYEVIDETIPPKYLDNDFELISYVERPTTDNVLATNPDAVPLNRDPNDHLYAVIINGIDYERFWGDISALYCTLLDHGYTKENIFVHWEDGDPSWWGTGGYDANDLDGGEYSNDIDYDACYTTIANTFKNMSGEWTNSPEIPVLGCDDQLLVYITGWGGHNNVGSYIVLPDYDLCSVTLADLFVKQINCAQMIFVIQPSYSGGFIDPLIDTTGVACNNRAVYTACEETEYSWWEIWETGEYISPFMYTYYTEFSYYFIAALRGYFPGEYPWEPGDSVEEGVVYHSNQNPDFNNDGIVSLHEARDYADYQDTYSPQVGGYGIYDVHPWVSDTLGYGNVEENPDFDCTNFIFGYNVCLEGIFGILGNHTYQGNYLFGGGDFVINGDVTFNNSNIFVSGPNQFSIINGNDLILNDSTWFTIDNEASMLLRDGSLLEVNNGSMLRFYEGSSLYGTDHTIWEDPATGQRYDSWQEAYAVNDEIGAEHAIPGDRIIVNDGLFCVFGTSDNPVTITSVGDNWWDGIEINDSNSYPGYGGINNGDISKIGHIKLNNSNFGLNNSTYSNCGQISAVNNSRFSAQYCTIDNIGCCPIYCCESKVVILNSTIQDNMGIGVYVYLPSDSINNVDANLITSNDGWGVQVIDAPIYCINDTIINNSSHGFVSYGAEGTPILAGNTIANNGGMEIVGLYQWPDMTSLVGSYGANTVYSQDNGGTDHYLLGTSVQGSDCRGNNINISNPTRFLPSFSYYIFDGEDSEEKILYASAVEDISEENYESAKTIMREIINDYPDTVTAISALQWLLYLENFSGNDYACLRAYAESIDDVSHPNLERIKNKVITSTYMCEKDYLTSIDRLEDVIADPPSVEDSILALINEGYCYLKLDEGGKAGSIECKFKPKSFDEFKYVSQNLTKNLLDKAIPTSEPPTTNPQTIEFALHQNYPNPASLSTTFSFSIPANTKDAELKIYNLKGQLVNTFIPEINEKGITDNLTWDCKDENGRTLSNGIYFYKLTADKKEIVKKMILMK